MQASHGIALCCTTHSLGGIELNVLRLAGWMRQRGHHCILIVARDAPLHRHAANAGIPHVTLAVKSRYKVFGEARALARRLADERIGTLVLNINRDLLLGVLTRRRSNGLRLVHMQHMQFGAPKRDLVHRWQHAQLDAWIAPLPSLAEQTARMTTVPRERIHVIPLGIDLGPFGNMPERIATRRMLGLPERAFVAGVVGRLDRGKGQEFLLRATAHLRSDGRDLHVLLVGEETRGETQDYAGHLHRLADSMHIADRVHFRGFVEDIPSAYAAMDVFTLTSLAETYGMVTIEALASGLPVIATETGGTPELLGEPGTALLVPAANAPALAQAIARVMDDAGLARELGACGRLHAFARFSHEQQCASLEQLLRILHQPAS
ncbi:MAG: glycosyltransferase family 4 protein [Bacteroidetes bacterium]|nr:glycosyltransferase family 4 protein [Bacteroidota bacterium]